MRTINFSEEDIKQCKLALTKQNLTPLQSAFLMQYITNIEQENKQLKEKLDCDLQWAFKYDKQVDNWNKLKEIAKSQGSFKKNKTLYDKFYFEIDELLETMQELERGSDSDENN